MDDLPTETLILVLKKLKTNDLLSVSRLSKFFYLISSDDRLWKDLFITKFGKTTTIFEHEDKLIKLKKDLKKKQKLQQQTSPKLVISDPQQSSPIIINNEFEFNQNIIQKKINVLQISILFENQKRLKGWKHLYRKHALLESSKELYETIIKEDYSKTEFLLSTKLLSYNNTYVRAAENLIKKNQTELLEKILKYCPIDSVLGDFYIHTYMRLITIAVQENAIGCAKLLLNHGADITYSNTNVLLLGCKNRAFTLNGEFGNNIGSFPRLCRDNVELSYYFLDALLSQITFFLCVQSGNETTLLEYVKTMRGATFSNKRTGIWDYGHEVSRFSGLLNEYKLNSTSSSSNLKRRKVQALRAAQSAQAQQQKPPTSPTSGKSITITDGTGGSGLIGSVKTSSTLGNSNDSDNDQLSLDNMSKVRFSQFKMIEKTLSLVTLDWSSEYCSYTPLHWAAKCGNITNIKTLLKMGSDVHALTSKGKSVCDIAKENNNLNCLIFLEKQMSKLITIQVFNPLFLLIKQGNYIGSLKFLSTFMFEKSLKHLEKKIVMKLIIYAIECNQPKIMVGLYPLCLQGTNISDEDGNTPIHFSAAFGRLNCLKVSIYGNNEENSNYNNNNNSDIRKNQIRNIDKVNKLYQTPLILATINGHTEIVKYLLEQQNARVDITDYQLNTALHYSFKYPEIVELLLEYHSDPLQINLLFKNSLHLAVEVSKYEFKENRIKSLNILLNHIIRNCQNNDSNSNNSLLNILNTPDIFGNTPLLISQSYYVNHENGDNEDISNEITNILLKFYENSSGGGQLLETNSNQLNLSFNDFKVISKMGLKELEAYLENTTPLKPSIAMLAILKLDGNISIETFEKLKLQHHLMLESYFKKLKFQNVYNKLLNIHSNTIQIIEDCFNIISIYQLKSFSYSFIEYLLSIYLISNRFEIPVYILHNLNRLMNSTTYIDRFQTFIFETVLHTPSISELNCRGLLLPYRNRIDSILLHHTIALDNYIMLKSIITKESNNNDQEVIFYENLPVSKLWLFSRIIKFGSINCCKFLTCILFKKSTTTTIDYTTNYSLLNDVKELRSIKNRIEIINILSEYDANSIISSLIDNPITPNANAYYDGIHYSYSRSYNDKFHNYGHEDENETFTKGPPIEIDYHQGGNDGGGVVIECCPNECGVRNIKQVDLEDHLTICMNGSYNCPNKVNGCSELPMKKSDLLNHLQSKCTYLHCHQCDGNFNRDEFIPHIFSHESDTWEICSLCNQMVKGFSSCYKNDIIHIRDSRANYINSTTDNNDKNNKNNNLLSSEYEHLKVCKNHFIKCHSCKITMHITEVSNHQCIVQSKIPILRNLLNIQNNNLVDLI